MSRGCGVGAPGLASIAYIETTPTPGVLLTVTSIPARRSGVSIVFFGHVLRFGVQNGCNYFKDPGTHDETNIKIFTVVEEIAMTPESRYHNAIKLSQSRSLENSATDKIPILY